ncbi:type II toxin-antitoxin system Phd/YefM family antitoxin [Methylobacterium dankookense]|uniref:type II toxin-antitoxin system Phd/YefM family antitoxin n=1 Tax=Methylobacterium dankookense TaxID=560405 RepID=UPI001643C89C|nr:type II toxin-antitoxin system prevent-host-death family antitoxin [Methylobacterium dankookense]
MRVSVTEAEGQLADLIRRAEAGDEVVLTEQGRAVARLSPMAVSPGRASRRALIAAVRASAAARATDGPGAARSQDFLYGGDGLPA